MAPIVSVVMPVFEQEAFVRRAIGSRVAQGLRDWELVIVDDGSQDGTAAAVEPYLHDPRVALLRLEENCGPRGGAERRPRASESPDHRLPPRRRRRLRRPSLGPRRAPARREPDRRVRGRGSKLRARGEFVPTGRVTCEWVEHPRTTPGGCTSSSRNGGEIRRADWNDLNYPARIPTLVSAGLPLLQRDNSGSIVAAQSLVPERDRALFFTSFAEVGAELREEGRMAELRETVRALRNEFTFDHHVDRLVAFFRDVCERAGRT